MPLRPPTGPTSPAPAPAPSSSPPSLPPPPPLSSQGPSRPAPEVRDVSSPPFPFSRNFQASVLHGAAQDYNFVSRRTHGSSKLLPKRDSWLLCIKITSVVVNVILFRYCSSKYISNMSMGNCIGHRQFISEGNKPDAPEQLWEGRIFAHNGGWCARPRDEGGEE
jgi:hypothetical protein